MEIIIYGISPLNPDLFSLRDIVVVLKTSQFISDNPISYIFQNRNVRSFDYYLPLLEILTASFPILLFIVNSKVFPTENFFDFFHDSAYLFLIGCILFR